MDGWCIGLMSGTSMDAVDAALCRFNAGSFGGVQQSASSSYPEPVRQRLLELQAAPDKPLTLRELAQLEQAVTHAFVAATRAVLAQAGLRPEQILVVGAHGQTVFHDPLTARSSYQLIDPGSLAVLTGIRVVADFRRADIALGGQGAPLVPAFHHFVFGGLPDAAIVNIGGIANVTLLGAQVHGFDTGPGNGLMNEWAQRHLGVTFDAQGAWAASGRLDPELLEILLAEPFFALSPPKSTGRDAFNLDWATRCDPALGQRAPANVQRTLCELTARTIADAIHAHAAPIRSVHVCGGGAHNQFLMSRLRTLLAAATVETTAALGLHPDWVEAAAFAWLGWRRLQGLTGNLRQVTGAREEAVLGGLYCPAPVTFLAARS